jgi:gliding motility-associated-like protein
MRRVILFAFLLSYQLIFTQNQHTKWYFGYNAGLDFSSGVPVAITGSAMATNEGSTSIADASGNILFYTDGMTVYNRLNAPMPNGNGLWGHWSSTQTAVIIQVPRQDSLYYIFTVTAQMLGPHTGMAWSMVDMRLDNGNGAVTIKNQALVDFTTEKLTATRHQNGRDVWVVAHKWNSDAFYAYLVTCSGIEGPVISYTGKVHHANSIDDATHSAIGAMKISPDGSKLALTWGVLINIDFFEAEGWLEYFDFNNNTGVVSNPGEVPIPTYFTYGVGFSPNSQLLYLTTYGLFNGGIAHSDLRQYNLNAANVAASEYIVAESLPEMGSIQLAPDGKLYVARISFTWVVSAVTFPDSIGLNCQWAEIAANISPAQSTWGLPNHWDTYPQEIPLPEIFSFNDTTVCESSALVLNAEVGEAESWLWSNGAITPLVIPDQEGIWWVEVYFPCDTLRDSVNVQFINCDTVDIFSQDMLTLCEGDIELLNANIPGAQSWLWSNGATTSTIIVKDSGWVWVQVQVPGSVQHDSIFIEYKACHCLNIPNVFTPNGDNYGDTWRITGDCDPVLFELKVFDRWGEQIYYTQQLSASWDGLFHFRECPVGVYFYSITWRQADQPTVNLAGSFTLVR